MKKIAFLSLSISVVLAGCSSDYRNARKEADAVHQRITENTEVNYAQVSVISKPPISIEPIKETIDIPWLNEPAAVRVDRLPLSVAISQIMGDTKGIKIWFDGDVDPNKQVTLNFSASRADVLNMLASQTGYGITPGPDSLEVRRYESEQFIINIPTGSHTGQLGSQGTQTGTGAGNLGGGQSRIEGQFINVSYSDVNVTEDISNSIRGILKKDSDEGQTEELVGSVNFIKSLSAISVRTTPDRMKQVRKLVNDYRAELSKQVLVNILVLEFRSNLGRERGVDWDIVKAVGDGAIRFFVPGTQTVSQGAGYGIAFTGNGAFDGTTALIKALKMQGKVSTDTPISALLLNHQPGRISQTMRIPYAAEITTQANDNVVSASVTRDVQVEGVDMMVTPAVDRDHVYFRISGKLTKIVGDNRETIYDQQLRYLDTREAEINFTNKLRYGQSVVIGSVRQDSITTENSRSMGGFGDGMKKETVETLVILTPRRVE
ncbi:hypothetical protein M2404_003880 [Rheinheimera pacifica]|uniref:hypothetical protein n=1 Tax=Rheinheimera pacifica TaxID=173990 RepID=UPI002169E2A6|nr:hypothetical protein [Rheinheimera pacifica]MCS4309508.1 hypothetical protein [Rheinheimera pacifica]